MKKINDKPGVNFLTRSQLINQRRKSSERETLSKGFSVEHVKGGPALDFTKGQHFELCLK